MKKHLSDYLILMLGAFLLAVAIRVFLVPMKIITGGVSGVATVLYYVAKIPLFATTLGINLILFFFGYRTLTRHLVPKNFAGILFLSFFLRLLENAPSYMGDLFTASLFGGALAGVGLGIAIRRDASTGGTDLAALMLHKRFPHISPSVFIMAMDTVIIVASGILFRDVTVMFYSVFSLYISNKVMDAILVWGDFAKSVTVISPQSDVIADDIMKELHRGVTGISAHGYYEGREGRMLYCVVRSRQVPLLLSLVRKRDPTAFAVVSDVKKVRGEGFERL